MCLGKIRHVIAERSLTFIPSLTDEASMETVSVLDTKEVDDVAPLTDEALASRKRPVPSSERYGVVLPADAKIKATALDGLRLHTLDDLRIMSWFVHPEDLGKLGCDDHESGSYTCSVPYNSPFRLHPNLEAEEAILIEASKKSDHPYVPGKVTFRSISVDASEEIIPDSEISVSLLGHLQEDDSSEVSTDEASSQSASSVKKGGGKKTKKIPRKNVELQFTLKHWSASLYPGCPRAESLAERIIVDEN